MKKRLMFILLTLIISFILLGCSELIEKEDLQNDNNLNTYKKIRYVILNDEYGELYKIYYYGIDDAIITVDGNNYDFEQAILTETLTLDQILLEMELYAELNDGGTEIYKDSGSRKYFNDSYTIIKCHTIDRNRDIYIGDSEMEYQEDFCEFKITDAEIKLQEEVEKMEEVNKIIIRNIHSNKIVKSITDKNIISDIIKIFSRSIESTLPVNLEGSNLVIQFYDSDNKMVTSMSVWNSGYFGFSNNKEYFVCNNDMGIFEEILRIN